MTSTFRCECVLFLGDQSVQVTEGCKQKKRMTHDFALSKVVKVGGKILRKNPRDNNKKEPPVSVC